MASTEKRTHTVLVVDDNADLLHAITEALTLLGNFAVVNARDGVEGIHRFYESRPDCAIIDIKMPGLNGYQLVRAVRGDPETAATPLVILTAMSQERDTFDGLAAGADLYLTKPIAPHELARAVLRAIQTSEGDREQRLRALMEESLPESET